ncbi:MAG: nickel-dependent lactate racemase [Deltaproteobacteria bacterium]|nr:nickel-dependent lactate racemase [Deltaproteobacteria bacterium]
MILELPYGRDGTIRVEVPDKNVLGVIEPKAVEIGDEATTVRNAAANPLGSPGLAAFLAGGSEALLVVNDATRPTPTARILDLLENDLAGIEPRFLVATGMHRAPTDEEYEQILGAARFARHRERVFAHDSKKSDDMVRVGVSRNGTEISLNRLAVEARRIVILSSVEPHYFAGYTGGRKSLLPGVAAYSTIEQNHKLALRPEARVLALEGNPVHEDMLDAVEPLHKKTFAVNLVLDKDHRVHAAVAGDVNASFLTSTALAAEAFAAPIPEKAEIVVSVVKFPLDIDLYQSQKGIDNAKHALKDGGILILVSKCRCGVGEESFARLLNSAASPADALRRIEQGYVLGYHKAAKMAEVALRARMWAVTDLAPDVLKGLFIRSCPSVQDALDEALRAKGPSAKILFLLDGALVVPFVPATA